MSRIQHGDHVFLGSLSQLNIKNAKKPKDFCRCLFDMFFKKHIFHNFHELGLYENQNYNAGLVLNSIFKLRDISKIEEYVNLCKERKESKISQEEFEYKKHKLHHIQERNAEMCIKYMDHFFKIYENNVSNDGRLTLTYKETIDLMNTLCKFGINLEKFNESIKRTSGSKKTNKGKQELQKEIKHVIKKYKISVKKLASNPDTTCKELRDNYKKEYGRCITKTKIADSTLKKYIEEVFVREPKK